MPLTRISMGDSLPAQATSRKITGDTQFMFQFYKPSLHFFPPHSGLETTMSRQRLTGSLVQALRKCPLLFGNFTIHPDRSITLDYAPDKPNLPVLEFQQSSVRFNELEHGKFSYSLAHRHDLTMEIPDGTITKGFDQPMLLVKVSYLRDRGVVLFSMTNHVAFDGNAMFSFLAYWSECNRTVSDIIALPEDLETYTVSHITNSDRMPDLENGPVEISVDATRTPKEIAQKICKQIHPDDIQSHVFSISMESLQQLKQQTTDSRVLRKDEWVSTNNVLAAFICQQIAQANSHSGVYPEGTWTLFQSLDMRRPLQLPDRGLGSPINLSECQATQSEIDSSDSFPRLALRIRQSLSKYTQAYCQHSMDWLNHTYQQLKTNEPWRQFWFTSLNTNQNAAGISYMTKIPIYQCDFGGGQPVWCSTFNPRPNYVIVFPTLRNHSLHLYVTLENPAMDWLINNERWNTFTEIIN